MNCEAELRPISHVRGISADRSYGIWQPKARVCLSRFPSTFPKRRFGSVASVRVIRLTLHRDGDFAMKHTLGIAQRFDVDFS